MTHPWFSPELFAIGSLAVGGFLLGAFGLLAWLNPATRLWPRGREAIGIACGLFTLAAVVCSQPVLEWSATLALSLGWLLGASSLPNMLQRLKTHLARGLGSPHWQSAATLLGGPLAAYLLAQCVINELPPPLDSTVALTACEGHVAWDTASAAARTDRGTSIPLFTARLDPAEYEQAKQSDHQFALALALDQGLIRTAPADPRYDCHGWVFAAGRYHVRGRDVELILRDNGYEVVSNPEPGDLAVYRNAEGGITHTGIVVSSESSVPLIEGKWGYMGRYVSPVDSQIYGSACRFYHSARHGHCLLGLEQLPPARDSSPH